MHTKIQPTATATLQNIAKYVPETNMPITSCTDMSHYIFFIQDHFTNTVAYI